MLLEITSQSSPATDLGYLLVKNPSKFQTFDLAFGKAHVFYPEARAERCTAALLLDLDPIALVRGRAGSSGTAGPLAQYVNDRPYVASSFLSVAMASIFSSAMKGTSRDRPELAATAIPLEVTVSAVACRGGDRFVRELFEPLGHEVDVERLPLDPRFPAWGDSRLARLRLRSTCRLADMLTHLYVLLPVLDDEKHYWIGNDELEKLLAKGEKWLATHPKKDEIVGRYLKRQRRLVREALERLEGEEVVAEAEGARAGAAEEEAHERPLSLAEKRMSEVLSTLHECGARSILDLGCGEGKLMSLLVKDRRFERIAGFDVSMRALEIAADRLHFDQRSPKEIERISLAQGSMLYRDERFSGFDAACLIEVIEHVEASRLVALERVVFEFARPATVVVTTPNSEYNVRFPGLEGGRFRHADHRFEWTRAEFESWAGGVAGRNGFEVLFKPVGDVDPEVGPPTQMAVFKR